MSSPALSRLVLALLCAWGSIAFGEVKWQVGKRVVTARGAHLHGQEHETSCGVANLRMHLHALHDVDVPEAELRRELGARNWWTPTSGGMFAQNIAAFLRVKNVTATYEEPGSDAVVDRLELGTRQQGPATVLVRSGSARHFVLVAGVERDEERDERVLLVMDPSPMHHGGAWTWSAPAFLTAYLGAIVTTVGKPFALEDEEGRLVLPPPDLGAAARRSLDRMLRDPTMAASLARAQALRDQALRGSP